MLWKFWILSFSLRSEWKNRGRCLAFPTSSSRAQSGVAAVSPLLVTREESETSDESDVIREESIRFDNYHLIWSPGFVKKLSTTTAGLFVARAFLSGQTSVAATWISSIKLSIPAFKIATDVLLPLFASSCCLLQLGINLLAGGCAGFNTILGPLRPYFLSLLLFLTATTRHRASYTTSILRWSMALLPEALHVLNTLVERRLADDKIDLDTNTPPGIFHATVELDIPTMGCVACINSIDAALRNSVAVSKMDSKKGGPRVLEAVSSLLPLGQKGGRATVRVSASNDEELTLLTNALVHAVTKVGFASCTVQSVRKKQKE